VTELHGNDLGHRGEITWRFTHSAFSIGAAGWLASRLHMS
jgi:hypothetical protein